MKKVYIAGKVTGESYKRCWIRFKEKEKQLIDCGYEVINPLEIVPKNTEWDEAMKLCINELIKCDAFTLLPDWKQSRGAALECRIAMELNLEYIQL